MINHGEILDLERGAWRALSTDGETAARYYEDVLADRVLMLLPGLVIDDRQAVIDSMRGPPWDRFQLSDERVIELGEQAVVLAYRATAKRSDNDYEAWLNSTYVRSDDGWKLVLHQQTPL